MVLTRFILTWNYLQLSSRTWSEITQRNPSQSQHNTQHFPLFSLGQQYQTGEETKPSLSLFGHNWYLEIRSQVITGLRWGNAGMKRHNTLPALNPSSPQIADQVPHLLVHRENLQIRLTVKLPSQSNWEIKTSVFNWSISVSSSWSSLWSLSSLKGSSVVIDICSSSSSPLCRSKQSKQSRIQSKSRVIGLLSNNLLYEADYNYSIS